MGKCGATYKSAEKKQQLLAGFTLAQYLAVTAAWTVVTSADIPEILPRSWLGNVPKFLILQTCAFSQDIF